MNANFQTIPLAEISPSPVNPRKDFSGDKFDELIASIKAKGVIEPIIVRPIAKQKTPFEIVAGERRFRASTSAGLAEIPAIIRELTDDEAYDFMLIENLQRQDLTEREEAESFAAYTKRHGKEAVKDLAEKTGIRPAYIRARIAALGLPKPILEAWEKGKLHYAHLEQLLRLPGPTEQLKIFSEVKRGEMTAQQLKHQLSGRQVLLSVARFDVKDCAGCRNNSTVQQELFGLGDAKAVCQNPDCFKGKQAKWFKEHWAETDEAKKYKTRGCRYDGELDWNKKHGFGSSTIPEKCLECESFVSIVQADGKIQSSYLEAQVCIGDLKCFQKAEAAARAAVRLKDKAGKKKAVAAGNAPRVSWHGEYFRDKFNRAALERLIPAADDVQAKRLAVLAIAKAEMHAAAAVFEALGGKMKKEPWRDELWVGFEKVVGPVLSAKPADVEKLLRAAIAAVVNKGETRDGAYDTGGFQPANRNAVALFLGADLAKEFAVSEEYLAKKTRAELLTFGNNSGIFKDPKAAFYLKTKLVGADPAKLKKSQLVELILKGGVDLVGRVPKEILK